MLKSYGYLRYDPVSERKNSTRQDPWWLILRCDDQLSSYYRWWIAKEATHDVPSHKWLSVAEISSPNVSWDITQKGISLLSSAWGAHVSVVRGEKPKDLSVWNKHKNKKISFEYSPEYLNTNGKHFWIKAFSRQLEDIREEMGLTPQPTYFDKRDGKTKVNPFHLTIGR